MISLETDMTVVGQADNGLRAVESFREHRPDVTLMDLRMPQMSGVEAAAAIRNEFPGACILMLSTYSGDEDIHRAMSAGARGYLLKDAAADELWSAIRCVASGASYLPKAIAQSLAEREGESGLTARETEVLGLLVKGLSNREIGAILGFTENTTKYHVKNILAKLGAADRTEAATVAYERGILHVK